MMRHVLIALFLINTLCSSAQEDATFRVVSASPGVTARGEQLTVGMNVTLREQEVLVPKGGFLNVLSSEGELIEITSATKQGEFFKLSRVDRSVLTAKDEGTHLYPGYYFPLTRGNSSNRFVGDSLFIFWVGLVPGHPSSPEEVQYKYPEGGTFSLKVDDVFDDPVVDSSLSHNWHVFAIPPDLAGFVIQVLSTKSNGMKSRKVSVIHKTSREVAHLDYNLSHVPAGQDKYLYECAIYQAAGLSYNMGLPIYHILKKGVTTTDPVLKKYFERLNQTCRLDLVRL